MYGDMHVMFFHTDTVAELVAIVVSLVFFSLSHFLYKFRIRLVTIRS